MTEGLHMLALKEDDVTKMLTATTHLGSENVNFQMAQYVYKRRSDGVHIINLGRTWHKLVLAARAIVAFTNPSNVFAISSRPIGQRAVLKYAKYTGSTAIAGRFTPGTFTNQNQPNFSEPQLLIVTDPMTDNQPINEASYVNTPVIAFCNTDSPLRFIDIAIPCNNRSPNSIGLMWWFLAREVLRIRGNISRTIEWPVMPDLFFYRDPEECDRETAYSGEQFPALNDPIDQGPQEELSSNWADEVIGASGDDTKENWGNDASLGAWGGTDDTTTSNAE